MHLMISSWDLQFNAPAAVPACVIARSSIGGPALGRTDSLSPIFTNPKAVRLGDVRIVTSWISQVSALGGAIFLRPGRVDLNSVFRGGI